MNDYKCKKPIPLIQNKNISKLEKLQRLRDHLSKKIERIGNKKEVKIYLSQLSQLDKIRFTIYQSKNKALKNER